MERAVTGPKSWLSNKDNIPFMQFKLIVPLFSKTKMNSSNIILDFKKLSEKIVPLVTLEKSESVSLRSHVKTDALIAVTMCNKDICD